MKKTLKIGTRSSQLALWQAEFVKNELERLYPESSVELVTMSTKGDRILEKPLAEIGGKGLFTEELEQAMLNGTIDLAVHSLKDMPTTLPKGLVLGAITKREIPFDALVSPKFGTLDKLPQGARVGTSSLRRQAQLLRLRPDLSILLLRGNVNTRLRKLDEDQYDAIVLAQAGLKRLGFENRITETFTSDTMIPAVGQGALAIECCADSEALTLLEPLNDADTVVAVQAERSFLESLNGGCQVPMGVYGICKKNRLFLHGMIASVDGRRVFDGRLEGAFSEATSLGRRLAESLCEDGAQEIVDELVQKGILS